MTHILHRERTGTGITAHITPACSCGWRGIGYGAHNDYQHTLVKDQEDHHLRNAARVERSESTVGAQRTKEET